jgi:tetratricopeptide (TPR) repeat protein
LAEATRVFVSYRRADSGQVAGRLADRLVEHFQVFIDIDTLESGMEFTETIRRAVTESDVFVAVIGPQWTELLDPSGQRRLDDSNDWVTVEIATALEHGLPVIPVLVDDARMPTRAELPERLAGLASRQAVTVGHDSFTSDSSQLVAAIQRRIPPVRRQPELAATQLANWEAQADAAAREGRWTEAAELLERITAADASYGEVARKLPIAQRQRRIAELHGEIRAAADGGDWQVVLNLGSELASLDPTNDDPDGLVTRARQSLAEARRRHLGSLFDRAVQAEAAGRWPEAADALQQINSLDPRNTDIANQLRAVRLRMSSPPSSTAGPASAAMLAGTQPGTAGSGSGGAAAGTPPNPEPFSGPTQPEQRKRAHLLLILVAAALALVLILVALVLLINSGNVSRPEPGASTSVSESPETTPTPTPESAELAQLLSYLPTGIRDNCNEYTVVDRALQPGVLTAVNCVPPADGPENAWYFLYEGEAATKKAFADFVTGSYRSGDCTKRQQMMRTFTIEDGKKLPAGVLKCYLGRGTNDTTFAWTNEDLHVLAFADDPDMTFPEMKAWWQEAGPLRNP